MKNASYEMKQNTEQLDLCTRIRLIEDRQRRQALAMQYLAVAVDRLIDSGKGNKDEHN